MPGFHLILEFTYFEVGSLNEQPINKLCYEVPNDTGVVKADVDNPNDR